jgi:8-oxo-dGTP diphosphatase
MNDTVNISTASKPPALKSIAAALYLRLPLVLIRWLVRRINTHFVISAAGLIRDDAGRVLLLRHVFRGRYPWGLPGGFIRSGESPELGMVRELREETGLDVTATGVAAINMITPRHMEVVVFGTVDVRQPLRLNHEIFEAQFFTPVNLPPDMSPDHRRRILEFAEKLDS